MLVNIRFEENHATQCCKKKILSVSLGYYPWLVEPSLVDSSTYAHKCLKGNKYFDLVNNIILLIILLIDIEYEKNS